MRSSSCARPVPPWPYCSICAPRPSSPSPQYRSTHPANRLDSPQRLAVPRMSLAGEPTEELTDTNSKLAQVRRDTLAQQIQEVHGIHAASIFFQVGCKSLLLIIELRPLVNERLQVTLTLTKVLRTAHWLPEAAVIQDLSSGVGTTIDWEPEPRSPEACSEQAHNKFQQWQRNPHTGPKRFVTSDATGLLASALLRVLVESIDVDKIH